MSVHALAKSESHTFSKTSVPSIHLIAGIGVEGDCHRGELVQHLSRIKLVPRPQNLRQVHLIPREILDKVGLDPGQIGENITTSGIDLLALGCGTKLHFLPSGGMGTPHAVVHVTGLRNPCPQIDKYRKGLKEKFLTRDADGKIIRRTAGIMGTVECGGPVDVGMTILVETPEEFRQLECV